MALEDAEAGFAGLVLVLAAAFQQGGGAGQRADSANLVPAEVVAQLKGRDMMVQRFAELLGAGTAAES